ncbi:hypothetical protein ZEAMMB73_Zm00001d002113 [Zea mays]|nr:hypothetical protein ZEAMMB73_Zm00001d002113 [Zea mays]ONM13098.1 hypothetical protein ZEAMMB73_Zm00001d002113 [Zea mays]ONM13102.1 hypothetical protein ZEAMMB73_Zm00001d002113 [Zea mays]
MSWSIQKENPLLRLTVENCELSSIGVIILLDCLTNAKQLLDVLSIADNHLGSPVAAALARFLGSHVRALNATDIGLGTVGFQILEETLPTEVALSHINIRRIGLLVDKEAPALVLVLLLQLQHQHRLLLAHRL